MSDLPKELLFELKKLREKKYQMNDVSSSFTIVESLPSEIRVKLPLVTLLNGDEYEGEWDLYGRMDGKGKLLKTLGIRYEGNFQANKKEGHVRMEVMNGEC